MKKDNDFTGLFCAIGAFLLGMLVGAVIFCDKKKFPCCKKNNDDSLGFDEDFFTDDDEDEEEIGF